jgi:magnesium chelatase family protein
MQKLFCATYVGIDAKVIDVEATLTKGLPSFSVVGNLSSSMSSDLKERVKSALLTNDFKFPPKRISISLSPSDIPNKTGSHFDLSIALLILLNKSNDKLAEWFVFGELGLDGAVKENVYLYPLILSLANQKLLKKVIVPFEALDKLGNIPDVEFYGVKSLKEAFELLQNQDTAIANGISNAMPYPYYEINNTKYYYMKEYEEDFSDVKGQEIAKRGALIAASGFHNILYEGSPGCGKSMIASRMQYILPPMTSAEILDGAKLDVLDDREPIFAPRRTLRAVHCTSSSASIFGGGSFKAKIGEVGLAHNGILFFDELPHFSKPILESMREPMQDEKIRVSRVNSKVEYPAKFLFIGAMNPCPCGNLLNAAKECRCSDVEIQRYKNKLSDPFLDRIDINVVMQNISLSDKPSLSSKEIHKMVVEAHIFMKQRGQKDFNAKLSDKEIEKYCVLDDESKLTLDMAINRFALSFRSIKKVQKLARTIADLDKEEVIHKRHLLEALSFRKR